MHSELRVKAQVEEQGLGYVELEVDEDANRDPIGAPIETTFQNIDANEDLVLSPAIFVASLWILGLQRLCAKLGLLPTHPFKGIKITIG
jgi:hypothetical protein